MAANESSVLIFDKICKYHTPGSSIRLIIHLFFVKEKFVDLRVIDFDWAGKAGQVHYPAERNTEIQWPGEAGGPIEQDHDSKMVDSWMKDLQ